uniref:Uncharacterized protein n=1 Tax=Aegilops tauschii subsp. strangulata TaxID=200361 RepID=A0A452YYD4_AEGTS
MNQVPEISMIRILDFRNESSFRNRQYPNFRNQRDGKNK